MFTRRNGIAAAVAALAIGLAAAGVGASTGSVTNEDRAKSEPELGDNASGCQCADE